MLVINIYDKRTIFVNKISDIENVPVAIVGNDWEIIEASSAFIKMLNWEDRKIIGRSFLDFVQLGADYFDALNAINASSSDGVVFQDLKIGGREAQGFWVRAKIKMTTGHLGAPRPCEITLTEIDNSNGFDAEKARQITLLDNVLSVVDSVFWVSRLLGDQILYVSPSFERIWGVSRKQLELDGRSWWEMMHPDDQERVIAEVRRCREARKSFDVEYRIFREDGAMRWIWDKGQPVYDACGNIDVYIGTAQDITERKNHEIELARLQSADNIGAVSADLAHNFNNLLTIVDLAAHGIGREDLTKKHAERLASIHAAVDRGAEITALLLSISSRQMLEPNYYDANEIIAEMESLIKASLGPMNRIEYDITALPCPIYVDKTGLNQAILNLIKNSREALPTGGEIRIKTRIVAPFDESDDPSTGECRVAISVEDTGTGMDEHTLRHATDPYFTTKSDGAGFGLAITNGFVLQSGGRLSLSNRIGGGLTARMTFPVKWPPVDALAADTMDERLMAPTILIVDDEPVISNTVAEILGVAGYEVSTSTDALDARMQLEHGQFAMVICDVGLSGKLSGADLVDWAKGRFPNIRRILMSGYNRGKMPIPDDIPFIRKPFSPESLLAVVRQEMDFGCG